ncbi:hypothetical protein K2Z83_16185 [Oscillochloris sp. ZM17-4]|uniref:hypothetical protein n=1 Tax=Oscillochloris sp. ZM17-4 TaxID=2866714 RepID=UPI001C73DE76|nr:hypothetical protein [Oscillochloris sp. ZM17-4]MBX0329213.1 hypothetical protein [Oscillochloris sp. ZM17-4]
MRYSILIVEEDDTRRNAWSEALLNAAAAQEIALVVTAARSATAAQFHAGHRQFHLLVASLADDGVGLAGRLRARNARLRVLLLHPPEILEEQLRDARWLGHALEIYPEEPAALVQAVGSALGLPLADDLESKGRPAATLGDVQVLLDVLRWQTKAQLVIYTDYIGNMIANRGDSANLDLGAISSLIAGSFVNSFELGKALRDPHTRHLSVLEGQHFDVFATNAGNYRLLALIFDKEFVSPKLGYAWLQLKRSADQLSQMRIVEGDVGEVITAELTASLNDEFDRLFRGDLLEAQDDTNDPQSRYS